MDHPGGRCMGVATVCTAVPASSGVGVLLRPVAKPQDSERAAAVI